MADNMEYVSRPELTEVDRRLSKEIVDNRNHIESHSREIARLEAVYQSLEGLPGTISNLEHTMTTISSTIETVGKNLSEVKQSVQDQEQSIREIKSENKRQNESISRIDNKSKIDIMVLVRDNFWKILSAVAALYIVFDVVMKKMGG